MSEQLQLRRGTAAEVASFIGAPGEVVVDTTNNRLVVQDGSAAGGFPALTANTLGNLPALGIGTAADAGNPLSVHATSALFSSAGDMRVKLDKAAEANTASFLFQDAFSGRAEIGLTGDDNFHFKVSPDGSTWHDALDIESSSGNVGVGTASPSSPLHISYDNNAYGPAIQVWNTGTSSPAWARIDMVSGSNAPFILFQDRYGNSYIQSTGAVPLVFATDNSAKMWITPTGNVGIGTPTPGCTLDIAGLVRAQSYTVGTLPAGVTGARSFVSDSTVPAAGNFGATVAGGGSNSVPVYYDGSNWCIG